MKNESITTAVEEHYAAVARGEASGCGAPLKTSPAPSVIPTKS